MTVERHNRLERLERGLLERVRMLETVHGGNRGTELDTARVALENVSRELEAERFAGVTS